MQNKELVSDFAAEAETHANAVEKGLLNLESGTADAETIDEIFRSLHSIKGTAGFFSLTNIVNISHAMENFFSEIRKGNFSINNEDIDILLEANDFLKRMLDNPERSAEADIFPYVEKIKKIFSKEKENKNTEYVPCRFLDHNEVENFFSSAIKSGQIIYKIDLEIDRLSTPSDGTLPEKIISDINSIGQLVQAFRDGLSWVFLFSSVLETSLVAMALNIPENKITAINDPSEFHSFFNNACPLSDTVNTAVGEEPCEEKQKLTEERDVSATNNLEPFNQLENKGPYGTEESIRVSVSLLNDLLNLVSELVLGRNQLLRLLLPLRKVNPGLNTVMQNIDNLTTELQEKILLTRMQPMSRVFNKFPRIVRELSKKTGKNVNLSIKGQEVELDKSIVEGLVDPLTHLVRNSIDHGIEMPNIREKAGKPEAGSISLHAYHEGGQVIIDIKDDGAGINVEKIKEKALENNLFTQAEIASMGTQELYSLLFRAGFSTASAVTDLSGRGVGLDVVKTNIEKLGGVMEVMSVLGMGTTFRLTMPLTLAIIPSIIMEVSGQKFALPQVNLQEMIRVTPSDPSKRIEALGDTYVLRLRERLLPIVHLADVLGLERANPPQKNQVIRVLIIKSGSKRFGLIVDLIHDGEEILVKQLPGYLKDCSCYSGVTILGDGRISMIIDPEGIANKAELRFFSDHSEQLLHRQESFERLKEQQSLLLFQCSGPETYCVDLSMVARVEKISPNNLEKIGNEEFIQFRGESLRVIRPEDYLPVNRGTANITNCFVIIPKLVERPIGILIQKIIANYDTDLELNKDEVKVKGLLGKAVLSKRITLVIDIYELLEMACGDKLSLN